MSHRWLPVWCLLALGLTGATDTRLADAAKKADRTGIRTLIEQQVDVNASHADGSTAMHWAAHRDDIEIAELLIRSGANVKAANRYGVTPLSLACTNGNGAMVELLLKAGADPNTALPGGETALMTAARTGKVDAVKALIAHGADIQVKVGRQGETALMWAVAEGNVEVVEALIKAGADFRTRLSSGFTPLLLAAREGHAGVIKALLNKGADLNDTIRPAPNYGRGPGYGDIPRPGTSVMLMAVLNAHYELAAYLLDAGADPNSDLSGWTALHAITGVRKPGVGDNDPAPDGSGSISSIEFVKKLVASGANVNARMTKRINVGMTRLNTMGATPFFLASRSADAELMRVLAALGADPLLTNEDNSTPLMAAAGLGTRSPGEDAGTEPEVLEAVRVALELGNNIDAVDNNGETAMHSAAYKNLPAVVELLASKGARIEVWNHKNKFGWTPLTIAEGHRFGNYKPSPVTIAAFHRVMTAAGVKLVGETEASGTRRNSDYGPRPPR